MALKGCTFLVTCSIGIGRYPADGADAATLLRHADAAMYLAKEKGKNNIRFYGAELADLAARQFELEAALRLAIEREELVLHFQPKVDFVSGRMLGLEALVRWQHPTRGLVPPNDSMPLAEDRGLIAMFLVLFLLSRRPEAVCIAIGRRPTDLMQPSRIDRALAGRSLLGPDPGPGDRAAGTHVPMCLARLVEGWREDLGAPRLKAAS